MLGSENWVNKFYERKGSKFKSEELSGVKPLKPKKSITMLEILVCKEFKVEIQDLSTPKYNNIARMVIIYLTVNYCGLSLKEAGKRYNLDYS